MTAQNYLILSYAAAKSASGIGMVMVSLARFWNDTFNCLPDFIAASMSGAIGAVGVAAARLAGLDLQVGDLAVIDLQFGARRAD